MVSMKTKSFKKNLGVAVFLFVAAWTMFISACSNTPVVKEANEPDNFTDEGFISDNIFQSIVIGKPDKNTIGLVEQRTTAYKNAEYVLKSATSNKLAKALCKSQSHKIKKTEALVEKFLKYGYIWDTHYKQNNYVAIIYRIKKKGLKNDVMQIPCGGKEKAK